MKKTYLLLFILAIGAAMLTACTDDDNNGGNGNPNIPLAELSKPKANNRHSNRKQNQTEKLGG